jgi:hypothetical protein
MKGAPGTLQHSDHTIGNGAAFLRQACKLGAEGPWINPACTVIIATKTGS